MRAASSSSHSWPNTSQYSSIKKMACSTGCVLLVQLSDSSSIDLQNCPKLMSGRLDKAVVKASPVSKSLALAAAVSSGCIPFLWAAPNEHFEESCESASRRMSFPPKSSPPPPSSSSTSSPPK
ncbi:hypothetical protein DQ04_05361050 [Trypanosoma grayi]|uniref:hypothetical protein n=1 Tax=Trypanosoma grayi TaxID=71804 RepID=UPI0004F46F29|nr:hypothetical protein DQ04_05361050 [Trypanosoma grayi]KEG09357.1 hypothetical protein DQ04_05361050 [Trypanosoma grayi]